MTCSNVSYRGYAPVLWSHLLLACWERFFVTTSLSQRYSEVLVFNDVSCCTSTSRTTFMTWCSRLCCGVTRSNRNKTVGWCLVVFPVIIEQATEYLFPCLNEIWHVLWLESEDESVCVWLRSILRFGFIVSPGWNSKTLPDNVAIQVTPGQQILTLHLTIRY